ncbi:unnamed protein product [Larinioides sclopetarius]|uniref:Uncharacterized protein n=1 Tax=Larinioides sclopetarius TaxID=280406 RepID=A0AAV2ADH7_9ARAC
MMQFLPQLTTFGYSVLVAMISICRKMGRKLSSCLLGIVVIFLVFTFHSLFNTLYMESSHKLGNTGHLRESTSGSDIDKSYSCIFRLGFSPTRGYEKHVGSRTTARIVDSFRFYPFLKKPLKLVTGPFPSDFWFLFDRAAGDITRFHGPFLKELLQKHDSKFLWFSREVEREVLNSIGNIRLNRGMNRISSLWFATRVIEDAGCETLSVYGIPDAQICKRNLNVSVPSLYWQENSTHFCDDGVDASVKPTNSKASVSIVPTIAERRLLPKWLERHFYVSDFKFPSWINWTT